VCWACGTMRWVRVRKEDVHVVGKNDLNISVYIA
jgi:hypothetical protein